MRKTFDGIDDALQVLRLLPDCIIHEAAAGAEDLENFLWFPTNIVEFAERLLSIAGLAAVAIYVDHLLAPSADAARDQLIENYIGTMLFGRGYANGIACSIVQRCGVITNGPLAKVIEDDRPITRLVTSRLEDPGNLVRSQLHDPPEAQLAALARQLLFLRHFSFAADEKEPSVRFRGNKLEARPFLFWDGRDLWRLQRLVREGGESDYILYVNAASGEERREAVRIDSREHRRIAEFTKIIGMREFLRDGTPHDEAMPQSVMPLFAEAYPNMNRLAQKIYEETTEGTRFKLWVGPLVGGDYEQARKLLTDEVFVTNAIIKQCLDRDPVSVMEAYFFEEPGDPADYFRYLVRDEGERRKLEQQIRLGVAEYGNGLRPFYCQSEHQEDLDQLVNRYRARLVAQKIVGLFGFPMLENIPQDGLEDYIRRARTFQSYLDAALDDSEPAKVREGLLACSRTAETVLKTLLLFYNSLRWFRSDHPEALDEQGRRKLVEYARDPKIRGFGTLLRMFRELERDQEVRERVRTLLGRETLWPEGNHQRIFGALDRLREWRNEHAHGRGGSINNASKLVEGFIDFLDWLVDPLKKPGQTDWRIFPAFLTLNVVTRNNCGISSIKYTLISRTSQRQITLYTQQSFSANAGAFFGLPHLSKTLKDLWVNPILIPASLFRSPRAGEANDV